MAPNKKYLSLEEAAMELGLKPDALIRLREKGEVRGFADRGTWKFKADDIAEYRRSQQPDSDPDLPLIDADVPMNLGDEELAETQDFHRGLDQNSDSDVRLVTRDEPKKKRLSGSSGEVNAVDLTTEDSDVRLVEQKSKPTKKGSDSDVQIVKQKSEMDSESDSDVKMVSKTPQTREVMRTTDSDVKVLEAKRDQSLSGSDSDVRTADSDSDVRVADSDSDVKAAESDSDVKLADSDSDVRLAPLSGSDSDVKLISMTDPEADSDSDVKMLPRRSRGSTDDLPLMSDDFDLGSTETPLPPKKKDSAVLLSGRDSGIKRGGDSGIKLAGDSGIKLAGDSGIKLAGDSGINLAGDSGIKLAGDSGIKLAGDSGIKMTGDSGIKVAGDSGIKVAGDSGIKIAGDSGIQLAEDSGVQLIQPADSGISLEGDSGIALGGDSGIRLGGSSGNLKEGKSKKRKGESDTILKGLSSKDIVKDDIESTSPMLLPEDDNQESDELSFSDTSELEPISGSDQSVVLFEDEEEEEAVAAPSKSRKKQAADSDLFEEADEELELTDGDLSEADEFGDLDFDDRGGDFDESFSEGESREDIITTRKPAAAKEAEWSTGTFFLLLSSLCVLVVGAMVSSDLLRTVWAKGADTSVDPGIAWLLAGLWK